ncbi:MAG: phospho-N-acetylmuramoyl-pentapeptide-transferase [Oscillospiraceae bacterium]|nr:phospho-N-acetylmuramoyl-pentapeptide-transferase [Oscillospiraceae bacterium]
MVYGVWTLLTAAVSFGITALLGKYLIPYLHKLNFGQTILEIGPKWHEKKQGTPTMGGIMFIVGICVSAIVSVSLFIAFGSNFFEMYLPDMSRQTVFIFTGLGMALCYGMVGFLDDYIKVVKKRNLGLTAIQKLVLQFGIAIVYLVILSAFGFGTETLIPFVGYVDLGFFYYILSAIVIVGVVNAVNLTDGIDGLDGSITFFASLSFMLIASLLSYLGVTALSAAVAGGCLGFLVWNFHPAKVFMGDTGSLFLGGIVCAVAFSLNMPILLLPIGIIYLVEMFSVMLQVTYFKLTHGKRLFKMSPIHHHFEMCGWSEVKIVAVFSAITAIFGALAFFLVFYGVQR